MRIKAAKRQVGPCPSTSPSINSGQAQEPCQIKTDVSKGRRSVKSTNMKRDINKD